MAGFAASANTFSTTCADLFRRMIDTVPAGTQFTDVIEPYAVKPVELLLTFVNETSLHLEGYIRVRFSWWWWF